MITEVISSSPDRTSDIIWSGYQSLCLNSLLYGASCESRPSYYVRIGNLVIAVANFYGSSCPTHISLPIATTQLAYPQNAGSVTDYVRYAYEGHPEVWGKETINFFIYSTSSDVAIRSVAGISDPSLGVPSISSYGGTRYMSIKLIYML